MSAIIVSLDDRKSVFHLRMFVVHGILCLMFGCANQHSQPEVKSVFYTPEIWASASNLEAQPVVGWIEEFGDDTLIEFSAQALARNPEAAVAAAASRQAGQRFRASKANPWPNLGLQSDASRSKNVRSSPPSYQSSVSLDLAVSWELDLWQRLSQQTQAAAWSFAAAENEAIAVRLSLVANVARTWFNLKEAQALIQLLQARKQNLQANHQLLTERFKEGLTPALDVLLARTDLRQTSVQLVQQQQELDLLKQRLQQLIGIYPDGSLGTDAILPALPKPLSAGLPADLLERRPDLVAARSRVFAASASAEAAQRNRYPKLILTARGGSASDELKSLVRDGNLAWALLGNLSQPLFDSQRLEALSEEAKQAQVEQQARYQQLLLRAFTEVEAALSAEVYLSQSLQLTESVQETAQQALELARKQYNEGLVDYATVLQAQRRAFDSQIAVIQIRNQGLQNRISLQLALGNGDYFKASESELPTGEESEQ